jgi:hypothetical protein
VEGLGAQLRAICSVWSNLIEAAKKDKKVKFQNDADEAMAFFKAGGELWKKGDYLRHEFRDRQTGAKGTVAPEFQTVVTKVAELQQLFGPTLYHQNPHRQVNPKQKVPVDPAFLGPQFMDPLLGPIMQQQLMMQRQMEAVKTSTVAQILEALLNWAAEDNDLKSEARKAIDDALIKGMGLGYTSLETDAIGGKAVVTEHVDIDDFLMDPDATDRRDILWCGIKCVHPVWEVERTYNLLPGSLKDKASLESHQAQAEDYDLDERNKGKSNDLITYYKIWSKCGFGDRLKGASDELAGQFDAAGDYVYLVICPTVEYPLNLAPETVLQAAPEELYLLTQWPIPFWMDRTHGWPFAPLAFHWVPGCIWPMSHIKPGLPYLKWLTWAMSWLMGSVAGSCGSITALLKSLSEETKKEFIEIGRHKLIELESIHGTSIDQIASVFKREGVDLGVLQAIQLVEEYFERATGLNELAYGMQGAASRSATDISIRSEAAGVRIEDLANTVEDFMSVVARNEAMASRWLLSGQDIAPVVGMEAAMFWDQFIVGPVEDIVRGYSYGVEAGSARRKNKQQKTDAINNSAQILMPILSQWAGMTGQVGPLNAMIAEICKAQDIEPSQFQLPPPPMPAPPEPGQEQGQDVPPQ